MTVTSLPLNTYKPYACGVVPHAVIDACLSLRERHALQPDMVRHVALVVHPQALKLTGIKSPASGLESKWSIYHSAAVVLARGAAGEHEYTDRWVFDRDVVALRNRIEATENARLTEDAADVTIWLADGRELNCHVEHALGSVERPMTSAQLSAKSVGLAEPVLPSFQARDLLELCWSLETLEDVSRIARASVPAAAGSRETTLQ